MKKRLVAVISTAVMVFFIGSMPVLAARDGDFSMNNAPPAMGQLFGEMPNGIREGMPGAYGGLRKELTDEEIAQIETERIEREEKISAFVETLSSEQKNLYDAAVPTQTEKQQFERPSQGQPTKADETVIAEILQKRDAFVASLTESQKATYLELFGTREEKLEAFVSALNSSQKTLYDNMTSAQPQSPGTNFSRGQQPVMPDESVMAAMREKQEAFIASLSDTQKAVYQELSDRQSGGHSFGMPGWGRK